jgi:hypothetical protein
MILLLVAAVVVGVAAYRAPHDDAQDALVIPFIVLWTAIAAVAIIVIDLLVQVMWRRLIRLKREADHLESSRAK